MCVCVGLGYRVNLIFSVSFCSEPKIALKNNLHFFKKQKKG